MEIILKQDIIGLGYKNDIVNVKSGYGRNFLIPTGKAVIASPSAKKQLAEDLKQQAHKLEAIKAEADYISKLSGGINISGMGSNGHENDDDLAEAVDLTDAFKAMGLSESAAKIAANGR